MCHGPSQGGSPTSPYVRKCMLCFSVSLFLIMTLKKWSFSRNLSCLIIHILNCRFFCSSEFVSFHVVSTIQRLSFEILKTLMF